MPYQNPQPGHWDSRQGIVALQYDANPSGYNGCVLGVGDSLREQTPLLSYSNLPAPANGAGGGSNYNTLLNAGFMGIGLADLTTILSGVLNACAPGRVILGIGTNDATTGITGAAGFDRTSYVANWGAQHHNAAMSCIVRAAGQASNVLLETIPYALDGKHDNDLIDALNTQIKQTAADYGTKLYDIVPRLFIGRTPRSSTMLSSDNVHLGSDGVWRRYFDEQTIWTGQPLGAI